MSFGDPPAPPDPIRTASAATATNVSTSVANAFLNNINQNTPEGSLRYDPTDTYSWNDPTTGQTYSIPRFTATQILSPQQQGIRDQTVGAQTNLATMANQQSGNLQRLMSQPFNAGNSFDAQAYLRAYPDVAAAAASSGMDPADYAQQHYQAYGQNEGRTAGSTPSRGDVDLLNQVPYAQSTFADVGGPQRDLGFYGQQQFGFGDAGQIQRDYGPNDFSADRSRVEESMFQRMDPQLQRDRASMEARLKDQGLQPDSPAYQAAMDTFNRQLTDTRLGIVAQGGQDQKLQADMAAQRAGFANAAQQQAYQQALGRGTFANQAQAQQFQEMLQAGTFANQAQKDAFQQAATRGEFANTAAVQNLARNQAILNAQNQQRSQFMAEQYQQRNQPINEITALLSGSQVSGPNFVNTPQQNIPTTDIAGLINNRFSQDLDVYKQQSANFNSLMGGIFGMMGGLARSDRRAKENIDKVGTVFAAGPDGEKPLPVYEYSFKDDPTSTRHVGPMAQDVEKIDPKAVTTRSGTKYIDRTRLGSILKVA